MAEGFSFGQQQVHLGADWNWLCQIRGQLLMSLLQPTHCQNLTRETQCRHFPVETDGPTEKESASLPWQECPCSMVNKSYSQHAFLFCVDCLYPIGPSPFVPPLCSQLIRMLLYLPPSFPI